MRKKKWMRGALALSLALGVSLSGCAPRVAEEDLLGNPWDENWTMMGDVVGVEETKGLTLQETMDVLAGDGLYYGSWVGGPSQTILDEESQEEVEIYERQIYLLVGETNNQEEALEDVEKWLEGAHSDYQLTGEEVWETPQGVYQVLHYDLSQEAAPLTQGLSAFAALGPYAVCAELTYQESFGEEAESLLKEFLGHCHYARFEG